MIRRSAIGPDERWPSPGGRHRWYAYVEELGEGDRPIGFVDAIRTRDGVPPLWVPFTLTGGRVGPADQLYGALQALKTYDVCGRSPMRVCPVCGQARRRELGPNFQASWTPHRRKCAMVSAIFS